MSLRKRLAKMRGTLLPVCIITVLLFNMPLMGYAQEIQPESESESPAVENVSYDAETDSSQTEEETSAFPAGAGSATVNSEEGVETGGEAAEPEEQPSQTAEAEEQSSQTEEVEEQSSLMSTSEEQPALMAAPAQQQDRVTYDYNADLYAPETSGDEEQPGGDYPGVYAVKIDPNQASEEDAPTIGTPSIADPNLDKPTMESPAIIQGEAVGSEEKTQDASVYNKHSEFSGTYVILRLDVGEFFSQEAGAASNTYLHVKQENNMALVPYAGMMDNGHAFADELGNKTGSYLIQDLLDQQGKDITTPYVDVLMFATSKLAAGADSGKADQPDGDIPIHFYMDDVADYNPDLKYDSDSTDSDHQKSCLDKFYDAAKTVAGKISNFLIKGSDLALEVAAENSGGKNKDKSTTYWSVQKALEDPYYDLPQDESKNDPGCGRTLKLISEVPVVDGITFKGTDEDHLRKRTLDLNSYDIQVANNSAKDKSTYSDGITLENAWLTITDNSNTKGAEMAIGNNAQFVIDKGGKLIVDKTCQLEIEWDEAVGAASSKDILNNGLLDLRAGGEIVNNGIITIEGTEGKPGQSGTDSQKGYGEAAIGKGAKLTNNGSMVVYGKLYNLGTLINNGKYDDVITTYDPDKGRFDYHKGIQISWKDDVTQNNVEPGCLYNGKDKKGVVEKSAILQNNGDILLNPGVLENYALLVNEADANIYLAAATEAIIPVKPTDEDSEEELKRITLSHPKGSRFYNYGTLINNGNIVPATVKLNDNGSFGEISTPGDHPELFDFRNEGTVINNGYIYGWDGETEDGKAGGSVLTGDTNEKLIYLYITAMVTALCGIIVVKRGQKQ